MDELHLYIPIAHTHNTHSITHKRTTQLHMHSSVHPQSWHKNNECDFFYASNASLCTHTYDYFGVCGVDPSIWTMNERERERGEGGGYCCCMSCKRSKMVAADQACEKHESQHVSPFLFVSSGKPAQVLVSIS